MTTRYCEKCPYYHLNVNGKGICMFSGVPVYTAKIDICPSDIEKGLNKEN